VKRYGKLARRVHGVAQRHGGGWLPGWIDHIEEIRMIQSEQKKVRLTFQERLLGTAPANNNYRKYVIEKAPVPDDPEVLDELETAPKSDEDTLITGFHRDADGIYLLDYQVKGFFKEAGNILKDILKIRALRSKLDNFFFVFPRYIWLAEKPDGIFTRPIRAQTPRGPRICLGHSEYLNPPVSIEITLDLLPHKELTWDVIYTLLDYGSRKGIGQFRNGSFGRFTWEQIQ